MSDAQDRLDDDVTWVMAMHDFMRSNHPMDEEGKRKLHEFVRHKRDVFKNDNGNQSGLCMSSAVTYAQADKLATLVDDYGADINSHSLLLSDRHEGTKIIGNLLEDGLQSYNLRPDVDRSPEGRKRLAQTVEFLLQRGVSAAPNPDPHEGAVAEAFALAYPDYESEGFDAGIWARFGRAADPAATGGGFREPYELIRKYQPEAVERFENAMGVKTKPSSVRVFTDAANGNTPLWKRVVSALTPSNW